MQSHVFQPIPSLTSIRSVSRDERLAIILANLEKHQNQVKASILDEGRRKLQAAAAERAADSVGGEAAPAFEDIVLLSNLSADSPIHDSCALLLGSEQKGSGPQQSDAPVEVMIAREIIENVDWYDRHSKKTRDYYLAALARQRGEAAAPPQPTDVTEINASRDPRRRPM